MQPILYFTSYAAVLVLFVSALTAIGWILLALLKAAIRLYWRLTEPRPRSRPSPQPENLKRAGQWP